MRDSFFRLEKQLISGSSEPIQEWVQVNGRLKSLSVSFDALLKRASTAKDKGQQVIVATSEEKGLLEPIVYAVPCKYIPYYGKIVTRI